MAPAEPVAEAAFLVEAVAPAGNSSHTSVFLVERLRTGLRKTYRAPYALAQKVLQRPHLLGPEPEPEPVPIVIIIVTAIVQTIVIAIIAYFYHKQYVVPARRSGEPLPQDQLDAFKTFKHNTFACFDEPQMCLMSCLCPAMRWSQTVSMTGLIGFWAAIGMYLGSEFLTSVSGTVLPYWILLGVMTYYRQQLRKMFDMNDQGGTTIVEDFCCFFWCPFCTVTQEARQLEDAFLAGHPAVAEMAKEGAIA